MTNEEKKRLAEIASKAYGSVLSAVNPLNPVPTMVQTAGGANIYSAMLQGQSIHSAPSSPSDVGFASEEVTTPTVSTPTDMGTVKTYDEWLKDGGGTSGSAYQKYLNSVNAANNERNRVYSSALTQRDLSKSTYGAEAEALRGSGLVTSAYSDYLQSKQDALYTGARAAADRIASDAKIAAETELYSNYAALNDAYTQELADVQNKSADDLYSLRAYVGNKMTEDQYEKLVDEWIGYNEKTGNSEAIKEYGTLSGKDYTEKLRSSISNAVSSADVANPTALMKGDKAARTEIAGILADEYKNRGVARSAKTDIGIYGLNSFKAGQKFNFTYRGDDENTDRAEIVEAYDIDSDMGILLDRIAGKEKGTALVVFNGKVYVKTTATNGDRKWCLTNETPKAKYMT